MTSKGQRRRRRRSARVTPTASLEAGPVHLEQQGTVIRQRMSFDDEEALKRKLGEYTRPWDWAE